METTLNTITADAALITKENLNAIAENAVQTAADGAKSYTEIYAIGEKFKKLGEMLQEKAKDGAIDELQRTSETDTRYSCETKVIEAGVKYDYASSKIYAEILDEKKKLEETLKGLEKMLQVVSKTNNPVIVVNPYTGETETVTACARTSKTTIQVKLK